MCNPTSKGECFMRFLTKFVAVFVLVCSATHAAQANQNSVYEINFKTPSGNIVCGGDIGNSLPDIKPWNGVSCLVGINNKPIRKKPKNCEFDWGGMFTLSQKGEAVMECYSDFPFDPSSRVLNYGETIEGSGWKCLSKKNGLLCVNKEGRGFELNRNQQKLF